MFLKELHRRWKRPDSWVEFSDDDFSVFEKRSLFSPRVRRLRWSEVQTISAFMWDCFSSHVSGFRFTHAHGHSVCVADIVAGWQQFREQMIARFPTIDQRAIEAVERAFPGEAELLCWSGCHSLEKEPNQPPEPMSGLAPGHGSP